MTSQVVEMLLIEDNADDEELILHTLREANLINRIKVIRDGVEALDYLFCEGQYAGRGTQPNPLLILLDVKLPRIDGIQVLEKIKHDKRTQSIPVVMLTSSREEPDIAHSYQLGANSYIVKPVDFAQFQQAIQQVGLYWKVLNEPPISD